MVSNYDIIKSFERFEREGKQVALKLNEDKSGLVASDTGEYICSIDTYAQHLREKLHCDFEVIYDEHVSLQVVYRCKECGTVIFARDDEDYDPNLCCPSCGGYKTYFEYWTKEEIDSDESKKKTIEGIQMMQEYMNESARRRKERGLNDWEIWKKEVQFKNYRRTFTLECCNLFGGKNVFARLKGLNLHIIKWEKDENGIGYIGKKFTRIPLSLYSMYIIWILPHTKKYKESVLCRSAL